MPLTPRVASTVRFERDERVVQVSRVTREPEDVRHALRLHSEDDGFPPVNVGIGIPPALIENSSHQRLPVNFPLFLTPRKFGKFGKFE